MIVRQIEAIILLVESHNIGSGGHRVAISVRRYLSRYSLWSVVTHQTVHTATGGMVSHKQGGPGTR